MDEYFQHFQPHGGERMEIDHGLRIRPMLIRNELDTDLDIEWVKMTITGYDSERIYLPEKLMTKTRFIGIMNELNRLKQFKDEHSQFRNQEALDGGFISYTMYVYDSNDNLIFSKHMNEDEYNMVMRLINFEITSMDVGGKRSRTGKRFFI